MSPLKRSRKVKLLVVLVVIAVAAVAAYLYLKERTLPTPTFTDITWEPEVIVAGRPVVFRLTLAHRSPFGTKATITVYVSKYDYTGFGEYSPIGRLEADVGPNSEREVVFEWVPPSPGFYRLRFEVSGGGYLNQVVYVSSPDREKEAFVFAVLGDNRPADGVMPQPSVFKEIVREINLIHPDFAIIVGDIIYGYDSDVAGLKRQWADFLSVYNSFEVPVFVAPGNHEMQTSSTPETGNPDAQTLYVMNLGRLYYAFAYGNSLFIILDTDVVGRAAEISGEQLEWLRRVLELSRNYAHTFVFMHRPIVSYEGADILNNHYEVLPLLLRYNVTAVFQGHNHVYYFEEVNGTLFYVTGGAGAPLYRTPEKGGVHHFLIVEVNGSKIEVKFVPPYALKVTAQDKRVDVEYTFRKRIVFRDDKYTWTAEPKPLTLRGIWLRAGKAEVSVEGGKVVCTVKEDGTYRVYVEVVVRPGEKKSIILRN